MPQDWKSVDFVVGDQTIPMTWYGENLWSISVDKNQSIGGASICATDYCDNKSCIILE